MRCRGFDFWVSGFSGLAALHSEFWGFGQVNFKRVVFNEGTPHQIDSNIEGEEVGVRLINSSGYVSIFMCL